MVELSSPYNWCDRLCERCPCAKQCTLNAVDAAWRAEYDDEVETWRETPPAEEISVDRICRALEALMLDDVESLPAAFDKLRVAALAYTRAVFGLCQGTTKEVVPNELATQTLVIYMKLARIADSITPAGGLDLAEDRVVFDGAPNVMLIDRIERTISMVVDAWDRLGSSKQLAEFRSARDAFRERLTPLLNDVPVGIQRYIAELVRCGQAPSPFCTTDQAVEPFPPNP